MKIHFDASAIEKVVLRRANKAIKSKKFLSRSAILWLRHVKADTVKGKSWTGANFPSIGLRWIKRKAALLSAGNPKSKFYRKGKSNASFMGDTVESLKTKVTGDKIELGVSGRHRVVKGVRGKPLKKSNAKIADIIRGLKSNGIDIMGVSKLTKKLIRKEFIKEFRRTK